MSEEKPTKVSIEYIKVNYLNLGIFILTMTVIAKIVFDFPLF